MQIFVAYIANATEELKNEVRTMELLGKTPEEHGLYVRQDIRGLHITSRNKMLHAGERIVKFSSSAVVWDTSRIFVDPNNLVKNSEACEVFLQKISDSGYEPHDSEFGNKIWNNIPRNFVTDFASSFAFDPHNEKPFPTLIDVINSSPEMEIWDVAIQNGSSDRNTHYGMKESKRNKYTTVLESDEISYIEFSQRRLISPTNTREGLEKGPENKEGTAAYITKNFGEGHKKTDGSPASPDAKAFLIPGRKPLLLIYYLDISEYEGDLSENPYVKIKLEEFSAYFKKNKDLNVIGLAFCFPDLGPGESKEPSIIITNKIYNMMKRNEEPDEESDEGDDI